MPKNILFVALLIAILIYSYIIYNIGGKSSEYKYGRWTEGDTAINQAQHVFSLRQALGENFESGPCLSNALMPNWVADIVHSPRVPLDDLPENQCSTYLDGMAEHFVELDIDGNFVRLK